MSTRRLFLGELALGGAGFSPVRRTGSGAVSAQGASEFRRPERKWPSFTTRPVILGRKGVVTSGHYLATAAGFRMLEKGGNAFDAAVAMGFACAVLEPHYYGIGGEVPILVYTAKDKSVWSISGQGPAPGKATLAWFREHGVDTIPGVGFLPATVPAATGAWLTLLERFGRLPLKEVLSPAIELAEQGYPAHAGAIGAIQSALNIYPTTAPAFRPRDHLPEIGELIQMPDWAHTFKRLVQASGLGGSREQAIQAAWDLFYKGDIARQIVDFAKSTRVKDSTGQEHHALLEYGDLASYATLIEQPVTATYRGYQVYKCGPWTQGPVFLQHLKILEGYDLARMGHNSADYIHTVIESAKLAFADRDAYYGDPRFVDVPLDRLLSEAYAAQRRKLIDPRRASMEIRPGAGPSSVFKIRKGLPAALDDTTHLDALDGEGNMVAATPSGGWINMSPIIPGLGFCLGVRGQMFWLDPEHPGCLQPGKRPRTTLTPTLVLKDGQPLLAFGTLGGDNQDQWTLQFFLNYVDFGMNLQEAIDAAGFATAHFYSSWSGHQANLGVMEVEGRISPGVVEELRRRGHQVTVGSDWQNGRVLAVEMDCKNGTLRAAASPRNETGYAFGW